MTRFGSEKFNEFANAVLKMFTAHSPVSLGNLEHQKPDAS